MVVVYTGSRNLYPYMEATIRSLLDHNDPERVYLLIEDDKFPYELPKCCKCINVSKQTYFHKDGVNFTSPFTYFCLLRVCLAEILPNEDKVISLDVDTIITDSLEDMWNIDLTDKWFAMCPEYIGGYRPFGKDQLYYNAGVALYNLKQIRKDNAVPMLVEYLNTTYARCMDQEAWNYFGQDKAVILPLRFNEDQYNGYTDSPAVIHYCGYFDWQRNRKMHRREYLDKYLKINKKYLIHTCNKREWYVKDYLVPSLIEQGIPEDDIVVWHDYDGIGCLASFVASCKWIGENFNQYESTWHLQDDIVVAPDFYEKTNRHFDGFANAFCNEKFDGSRTNYFGVLSSNGMWFSFQCILIPNDTAKRFAKWFEEDCVPNDLYPQFVSTGKCDDSLFREYVLHNEPNITALNIYPCIVDHIDYLIGDSVINYEQRGEDKKRQAYWRDEKLDEAVETLKKKLAP